MRKCRATDLLSNPGLTVAQFPRLFIRQSVWHTHTTAPKTQDSEGGSHDRPAENDPGAGSRSGWQSFHGADTAGAEREAA
jgi:hypothetical protein